MEDIDSSPVAPNPLKRAAPADETSPEKKPLNLKGTQFMMPTPPDTDQSSNASPNQQSLDGTRDISPAPSHSTLTSVDMASPVPQRNANGNDQDTLDSGVAGLPNSTGESSNSSGQPPAKRRKLTPAEKQLQQKEKEAKAAERAELKAIKDEEKRLKEEEKQKKAEAKEEEKRAKDEEKRAKEEEKRLKDEEKQRKAEAKEAKKREKEIDEEKKAEAKKKKEASQMRLGAFFQVPAGTPSKSPGNPAIGSARRKSLSLEPFEAAADRIRASQSPCKTPRPKVQRSAVSDYHDYFKPFHLPTHSSLPDTIARGDEEFEVLQVAFDNAVQDSSLGEKYDLSLIDSYASLGQQFAEHRRVRRGLPQAGVRQLVDQIQGSSTQPIDLTEDTQSGDPWSALHAISRRQIQFEEDVRPAYFGTYTKIQSPRQCAKLQRNPFSKGRQDTDYDYDSEAEWQEEEEGEDIMGEEDDEAESVAEAGEMDEFLDDEEDSLSKGKRKIITGDLVPTSTGLCWENGRGEILPSIESATESSANGMHGMGIGFLLPGFTGKTINPFSTSYWVSEPTPAPVVPATTSTTAAAPTPTIRASPFEPAPVAAAGAMPPPRAPLQPRPNGNGNAENVLIGAAEGMKGPITSMTTMGQQKAKPGPKPAAKTLSNEDLEEFKEAVVGSPLGKADLLKGLKSRFPKITNETIKASLGEHFAQVGASKADKKWVFVPKI